MDFEKLGAFYLGRRYDGESDTITEEPILYDAKDLTTHATCVGMTGSGKTGLCLGLLEEAALDGIPAICIDPKGDLGNLLLTFPQLRPGDFAPWIDPADARGQSVDERAAELAARWKGGLAEWGQDGARIQRFRDAVDLAIYTPGSTSGLGLSVLRSLSAPEGELDADALRERVQSSVSGLLAMVGVDADPIQSREHVFLSNVLHQAWSRGESLELGGLVRAVLEPPFARVGVLDLDAFFPAKDRQALAMRLNGLLASPGFSTWLEGEPLDAKRLLWTPEGKPRISILNIAHLSEAERMFFVTLLLNEVVTWMRTQPGTSSLRALLYMDEVFGFLPPVKAPPSKTLFLTLLKQARAYGLGLVLATQNPVDLDYKALSNCGTWFLGRLQTERDVDRVIDGLLGSGAGLDAAMLRKTLAGLDPRTFLMHDVHEDGPVLFHTRWVMSFLRGPLSKPQIKALMSERREAVQAIAAPAAIAGAVSSAGTVASPGASERPAIEAEIDEIFVGDPVGEVSYEPAFLATVQLHHAHARYDVDEHSTRTLIAPIRDVTPAQLWKQSHVTRADQLVESDEPHAGASWGELPRGALSKSRLRSVKSALKSYLYKEEAMTIYRCRDLKLTGKADEDRAAFVARCRQALREERDEEVDKVKAKFAKKHAALMRKVRRAEEKVAREKSQVKDKQIDTALSVGTTVLGALFGRRTSVTGHASRAASAARRGSKVLKEQEDVKRAELALGDLQQELVDLDEELQWALTEVKADASEVPPIDEVKIAPKKRELDVERFVLAWVPV